MSDSEVLAAFVRVKETFPIVGYVDDSGEGERAIAAAVIRACPARGKLIDIGAGSLVKTAMLAQLGFECSACDDYQDPWHQRDRNLESILAFAKEHRVAVHVFPQGDYSMPFPENSFDVATIFDVVEHLHESPRDILNAAGALLKPGGVVVVTMPNSVNLKKRLKVLAGRSNYVPVGAFFSANGQWRGHVREYTLAETRYIVEAAGFEVVESHTFDRFATKKIPSGLARSLYRGLATLVPTFRDSLFVVGRKPAHWTPRLFSEAAYREALGVSVPEAVR